MTIKAITVTRSFSKKKQLANFEPIESFCSVQAELETDEIHDQSVTSLSQHLDILVRQEVERTIESEMKKVEELKKKHTF